MMALAQLGKGVYLMQFDKTEILLFLTYLFGKHELSNRCNQQLTSFIIIRFCQIESSS